jgi:hypothetical protein
MHRPALRANTLRQQRGASRGSIQIDAQPVTIFVKKRDPGKRRNLERSAQRNAQVAVL